MHRRRKVQLVKWQIRRKWLYYNDYSSVMVAMLIEWIVHRYCKVQLVRGHTTKAI